MASHKTFFVFFRAKHWLPQKFTADDWFFPNRLRAI